MGIPQVDGITSQGTLQARGLNNGAHQVHGLLTIEEIQRFTCSLATLAIAPLHAIDTALLVTQARPGGSTGNASLPQDALATLTAGASHTGIAGIAPAATNLAPEQGLFLGLKGRQRLL